ncbi:hypothetical protein M8C21_024497 [Ambrosia artemisiifolia]|uniref:Glutathione synthase substrate-binding domain-containing protein n=1 Tax=Ambrosia artemisiifolia TaxID=4212 RepID=A0AAD5BTT1_AMBAR|nr:hypothetical protein M8C21_024497 [Ambrosia artemisiifolia]
MGAACSSSSSSSLSLPNHHYSLSTLHHPSNFIISPSNLTFYSHSLKSLPKYSMKTNSSTTHLKNPVSDPHTIDSGLIQKLVHDALVWSSLHGLVVGDRNVECSIFLFDLYVSSCRSLLSHYKNPLGLDSQKVPINTSASKFAEVLAKAWTEYSNPSAVVLVVVQPGERNMYDQHWLTATLKEKYPFLHN